MQVWNVLHATRWKYRTQNIAKNSPSAHHHITLSGYVFATKACIDNWKKNLLNSNIFPTCSHDMLNPLPAEIGSLVWATPANFNRFRVLASLLQRRRSAAANQILHNVWPSPGWVHYIYIFGGSCRVMEFCQVQFTLCSSLALSYIGSITALHSSSRRQPNFAALSTGRHIYSACRPSCWALAHILVFVFQSLISETRLHR